MLATWSSFKRGTVQSIAWRWGVAPDNIPGLVEAQEGYRFDPTQVTCPALALVGEGEYQDPEVQHDGVRCSLVRVGTRGRRSSERVPTID